MKRKTPGGRTFYLILLALLSSVLIMAMAHALSVYYQNRHYVAAQKTELEAAMVSGSQQIDAFWDNVSSFLFTLTGTSSLNRLDTYPNLPLQEASRIQTQTAERLAAFLSDSPFALEAFVSLRHRSYLITPEGVTERDTYFGHRYQGEAAAFHQLLGEKYAFHLMRLPFALAKSPRQGIRPGPLALIQTLYDKGQPLGNCVITLDVAALEQVFGRYVTIHGTCTLLLDGAPLQGDGMLPAQIPPAGTQAYLPGIGVVIHRPSPHFAQLSYLLISPESTIFPRYQGVLATLMAALLAVTLLMGLAAFLVARRLYQPMRTLLASLDNPISPRADEYKLIRQSIHSLERQWDDSRQELLASSPLVRDALLHHLLVGSPSEDRLLMEKYLPGPPTDGLFYVFALAMAFQERETAKEGEVSRRKRVLSALKQTFGGRMLTVIPIKGGTRVFITLPLSEDAHQQLCRDLTRTVDHLADTCPGGMVLLAGGSGASQMDWISRSHQEALHLLAHRPANAAYAFLSTPASDDPAPLFPRDCAGTLMSLIHGDRPEDALDYVKDLLDRLRQSGCSAKAFTQGALFLHQQVMLEAGSRTPSLAQLMVDLDPQALTDPQQQLAILQDNIRLLLQNPVDHGMDHDLTEIVRYIQTGFSTPMTLNSTADHFGYSPSYFSRYFKQRMGLNFTSYLQRVRMEHACRLLGESALSVGDVAHACGYQHPSTFIAAFEKAMGMTPGAFRKVRGASRSENPHR